MLKAHKYLTLLAVLAVIFSFADCSPKSDKGAGKEPDAIAVDIDVDQDSYFGIRAGTVIGDIWFSDSVGLIGTPIKVVVQIDEKYYPQFKDTPLFGTITLVNTDSTKDGDYEVEFTIDDSREEFEMIIPQVKTVPTVLDFDILIEAVNPNDENQVFQASLYYQFLVNNGTPAT